MTFATLDDLTAALDGERPEKAQGEHHLAVATATIRGYCQQHLSLVENDVLEFLGAGPHFLPETPVVAVSRVEVRDRLGAWTSVPIESVLIDQGTGLVHAPGAPTKVRVTYTHGYQVIPNDLRTIAAGIAARFYQAPSGLASERIGQTYATYRGADVLYDAERVALSRYRMDVLA